MLRIIFIVLGFLFAGIGMVGIVLPVLPTTPFLLLALFFFSKGSKKFELWFTGTKLYKNYLEEFVHNRAMTLKTKIQLVSFASTVLLISAYFVEIIYFRIFIVFVMLFKYYYFIFRIETIDGKDKSKKLIVQAEEI